MKRCIIESPYNPTEEQIKKRAMGIAKIDPYWGQDYWDLDGARKQLIRENVQYARLLCKHALEQGLAPFASHLNYTQVWSEEPEFRTKGIEAGYAWLHSLGEDDEHWFGVDLGWSSGMQKAAPRGYFDHRTKELVLFPEKSVEEVRAHLSRLPWESFAGLGC